MQQLINELNDIYGLAPKEEYVTPAPVPNGLGFQDHGQSEQRAVSLALTEFL